MVEYEPDGLVTQPSDVSEEQSPLNTSNTGLIAELAVTVTLCLLEVAVNLNQISSSAVPAQPGIDCVAPVLSPSVTRIVLQ